MSSAKSIALGGVFAALAMVNMCLGGLIPVATYVCPMFCTLLLEVVRLRCGSRIGWAWYGAVALLSALLGPDKEAAALFVGLGYYPLVKPWLDRRKLRVLWKLVLFNGAAGLVYAALIGLLGMDQLLAEFQEFGQIMLTVYLVLANLTFLLLDRLLARFPALLRRRP